MHCRYSFIDFVFASREANFSISSCFSSSCKTGKCYKSKRAVLKLKCFQKLRHKHKLYVPCYFRHFSMVQSMVETVSLIYWTFTLRISLFLLLSSFKSYDIYIFAFNNWIASFSVSNLLQKIHCKYSWKRDFMVS